ncbi:SulP family inorganic anion transporter [Lacisediminimonas sp.]|uniref:SulP family inorganic anion transporter n=1 Tax=Lacisediminimonas sp. TaxID=3060582 RepID=UPI002728AFB4|nr:SulP family inorganic anion transporter [Lacisediminimonas sp.]MDO8298326.1 SulP family inorganic anion transporter [Lacisediminimonas sp.]MDO9217202.1 SulP family inorganic anion transporter [Lacisediminimonas sp.]
MNLPNLRFRPRLIDELRDYDSTKLGRDLGAGLTVAVVALPLAMAFAIASGVKPEAGLFTAIIAGFLISALGGSRVQIGGPAGAFIVIIYGILERYGLANLMLATIFAGVLLFVMGALKLGSLIRYIPIPIVIGFTNGIAVLIALSQLKDFFGLRIDRMPGDFFAQVKVLASAAHTVHLPTLAVAAASLALVFIWPLLLRPRAPGMQQIARDRDRLWLRLLRGVPGTIIVLVLATAAVGLFKLPLETIGTRFGGIPQDLPAFAVPEFNWALVQYLLPPALTIALLGAIESLLCARVADSVIGERHDPNQELMAQGVANFIVPFFGGLPATGTIARTMTNIRSGAASPVAGIVHAFVLLLIVLIAAPLASDIPLAALAAILLFVAWNMGEWHEFARLRHFAMTYRVLLVATFVLTVAVDLTVAVEVGLVLACLFFIYRISSLTTIQPLATDAPLPEGVHAYSMVGALFFGAVGKIEGLAEAGGMPRRALVLELHKLINMDATGLDALESVHRALAKNESQLILCGLQGQPKSIMERSGFLKRLGADNCVDTVQQALARAAQL